MNCDLLHYKPHKISLNRGGSYIVSPKQLNYKKAIINPKNNDDKYFQYAITAALNYEKLKSIQMERFCKDLKGHATKILNSEKK